MTPHPRRDRPARVVRHLVDRDRAISAELDDGDVLLRLLRRAPADLTTGADGFRPTGDSLRVRAPWLLRIALRLARLAAGSPK